MNVLSKSALGLLLVTALACTKQNIDVERNPIPTVIPKIQEDEAIHDIRVAIETHRDQKAQDAHGVGIERLKWALSKMQKRASSDFDWESFWMQFKNYNFGQSAMWLQKTSFEIEQEKKADKREEIDGQKTKGLIILTPQKNSKEVYPFEKLIGLDNDYQCSPVHIHTLFDFGPKLVQRAKKMSDKDGREVLLIIAKKIDSITQRCQGKMDYAPLKSQYSNLLETIWTSDRLSLKGHQLNGAKKDEHNYFCLATYRTLKTLNASTQSEVEFSVDEKVYLHIVNELSQKVGMNEFEKLIEERKIYSKGDMPLVDIIIALRNADSYDPESIRIHHKYRNLLKIAYKNLDIDRFWKLFGPLLKEPTKNRKIIRETLGHAKIQAMADTLLLSDERPKALIKGLKLQIKLLTSWKKGDLGFLANNYAIENRDFLKGILERVYSVDFENQNELKKQLKDYFQLIVKTFGTAHVPAEDGSFADLSIDILDKFVSNAKKDEIKPVISYFRSLYQNSHNIDELYYHYYQKSNTRSLIKDLLVKYAKNTDLDWKKDFNIIIFHLDSSDADYDFESKILELTSTYDYIKYQYEKHILASAHDPATIDDLIKRLEKRREFKYPLLIQVMEDGIDANALEEIRDYHMMMAIIYDTISSWPHYKQYALDKIDEHIKKWQLVFHLITTNPATNADSLKDWLYWLQQGDANKLSIVASNITAFITQRVAKAYNLKNIEKNNPISWDDIATIEKSNFVASSLIKELLSIKNNDDLLKYCSSLSDSISYPTLTALELEEVADNNFSITLGQIESNQDEPHKCFDLTTEINTKVGQSNSVKNIVITDNPHFSVFSTLYAENTNIELAPFKDADEGPQKIQKYLFDLPSVVLLKGVGLLEIVDEESIKGLVPLVVVPVPMALKTKVKEKHVLSEFFTYAVVPHHNLIKNIVWPSDAKLGSGVSGGNLTLSDTDYMNVKDIFYTTSILSFGNKKIQRLKRPSLSYAKIVNIETITEQRENTEFELIPLPLSVGKIGYRVPSINEKVIIDENYYPNYEQLKLEGRPEDIREYLSNDKTSIARFSDLDFYPDKVQLDLLPKELKEAKMAIKSQIGDYESTYDKWVNQFEKYLNSTKSDGHYRDIILFEGRRFYFNSEETTGVIALDTPVELRREEIAKISTMIKGSPGKDGHIVYKDKNYYSDTLLLMGK